MSVRLFVLSRLLFVGVLLVAACLASPSRAADDACLPGGEVGFDPASGDYIRPNRDVRFCSGAILGNPTWDGDVTCRVTVDGAPYASSVSKQLEVVVLQNPTVPAGSMAVVCEIPGIDPEGAPIILAGQPTVVAYQPVPLPEAPVPLE